MGKRKMLKYPVIIEKCDNNYSAFSPDLPGCIATGKTEEETLNRMKEAINFHIEGLKKDGFVVPEPSTKIEYIDVSV